MDCLAKIGGAILGPVFSYMFAPVGHQLEYLFSYKDKVKNLEGQVRKLDDIINMIQSVTEQAKNEGNAIMGHVQDWQKDATTESGKANHFLEPAPDHTRARCSCRWPLPNLALRRRLSMEAKEMAEEIERLIGVALIFGNNISFRPAVQHSFEQKDFEKFETREKTLSEMMEALQNPEVRMIGLCGFGGMGKTMLVKEVARLAKEGNLFSRQVMVVVSQNLDINRIQQQIADQLGLKFEKEDVTTRAELLEESLKKEQKILIVLDDVWTELDLSEAGIRFKDDNKEWKIILTSRFQGVCRAMGADEKTTLEIKGLNNGEAMDLFNRIVGDVVDENSEFRSIATEVIGECGGLPLAIVTIARALKINKSLSFWTDALLQLKQSSTESLVYGKIYNCFKTVYDELGNEAKSLLLICSVYEDDENVSLQELMGYVMVLDLFRNVRTLKQASDRVESLVYTLKAYCLLSDGYDPGTVKVHDVIRDVAISIASELEKNPMYCLRENERFEDCLNRENFKELYAISVPGGGGFNDDQLPERLACPRLKLLMLTTIGGLEITDRFFEETKELKALRLDVKGGKKLASFFRSLQNLKALQLRIWKGEDVEIAIIGELTNLLILDLSESQGLVMLPKEIGNLSRLQLLNLNRCQELKVIEPNVISRLVQLEELYMDRVWYLNWETEGEINASLTSEIKDLRKLRVLHMQKSDGSFVPEDMFNHLNLERYLIIIGESYMSVSESRARALAVNNLEDTSLLYEDGFQRLMKKSEELRLVFIAQISHIVNELDASSFQDLERLELIELGNLESFMPTSPPTRSIKRPTLFNDKIVFNNLRELNIKRCKSLRSVWASATFISLQQLKKLYIDNCDLIEEVLVITKEAGDHEVTKIPFPKLESLELRNLPKLKRFGLCQVDDHYTVEFPSLLRINIIDCPELRTFIAKSIPSTCTAENQVEETEVAQEILFRKKDVFNNLQELTITRCKSLQSVWALATFENLQQLEQLCIQNCDLIEEILVIIKEAGDPEETKSKKIPFPKLKSLKLKYLPKLKRFGLCQADDHYTVEFPSVLSIDITHCHELRTIITKSIPSMSTTVEEVEGRNMAQEILPSKKVVAEMSFRNLQELGISEYNNVQYMFSFAMVESLIQLKWLYVSKCDAMEQIVTKAVGEDGRFKNIISFPKLETLVLENLPELKRFCEGDCIEFPSLLTLEIWNCNELKTFIPNSHESTVLMLPAVEERELEAQQPLFNEKVAAGMSFRNLQKLTIFGCNNVQYMFSFAMVESLIQLKELKVSWCEAMEQIVTKAVGEDGRLKNISFPKLEVLELEVLPKFTRFCEGDCIEFASLLTLRIRECNELRTFIPNSHESTIPTLQAVDEERELEAQQPLFNEKVVVTNLTELQVRECHGLISLFNSSTAISLAQLRIVVISKCNQMTQVMHVNGQMEDESAVESEIVFSQLKILALFCLPNLKCFHGGNNKLQFPNFEKIIAYECPEMRSFSHGTINTPKLDRLIIAKLYSYWLSETLKEVEPIEELWEGDLNRTIRKLWDDAYIALQWIFSETVDDQNSEEDTAGHDQKIQNNKESAASSSSK